MTGVERWAEKREGNGGGRVPPSCVDAWPSNRVPYAKRIPQPASIASPSPGKGPKYIVMAHTWQPMSRRQPQAPPVSHHALEMIDLPAKRSPVTKRHPALLAVTAYWMLNHLGHNRQHIAHLQMTG